MKIILIATLLSFPVYSQSNAELQQQLLDLQKRMKAMEKKQGKPNGLKMKDFGGEGTGTNSRKSLKRDAAGSEIPEAKMNEIMKALKKGDSYLKERDAYLKELENEE